MTESKRERERERETEREREREGERERLKPKLKSPLTRHLTVVLRPLKKESIGGDFFAMELLQCVSSSNAPRFVSQQNIKTKIIL